MLKVNYEYRWTSYSREALLTDSVNLELEPVVD